MKSGFTLLETLVAISIFTVAVLGPLNLATYSIRLASYSRNQTIAFYLAEEAIEYIRNKRDSNVLAGDGWLEGLYKCIDQDCYIDVINDDIKKCNPDCPKIKFDKATGFYGHAPGWNDTIFTRKIQITTLDVHEVKIMVEMLWKERFLDKSFLVEGYIYDWK